MGRGTAGELGGLEDMAIIIPLIQTWSSSSPLPSEDGPMTCFGQCDTISECDRAEAQKALVHGGWPPLVALGILRP